MLIYALCRILPPTSYGNPCVRQLFNFSQHVWYGTAVGVNHCCVLLTANRSHSALQSTSWKSSPQTLTACVARGVSLLFKAYVPIRLQSFKQQRGRGILDSKYTTHQTRTGGWEVTACSSFYCISASIKPQSRGTLTQHCLLTCCYLGIIFFWMMQYTATKSIQMDILPALQSYKLLFLRKQVPDS